MNRRSVLGTAATVLACFLLGDAASAATKAKVSKKQLIGNWILVSNTAANGRPFGPNDGYATFSADGRFSITLLRSDLPKFASNNRDTGSADENKAIVQGSNAYFGTYSLNEADGTVTLHIERASFPNWAGTDQQRLIVSLTTTELKYTNPAASTGGTAELGWKRVK
jgi:Lipocalin-like domain